MGPTLYMHLTESNYLKLLAKSRYSYLKIYFGYFCKPDEGTYFQAKYMNRIFTFLISFTIDSFESPLDRSRFHILSSFFYEMSSLKMYH